MSVTSTDNERAVLLRLYIAGITTHQGEPVAGHSGFSVTNWLPLPPVVFGLLFSSCLIWATLLSTGIELQTSYGMTRDFDTNSDRIAMLLFQKLVLELLGQ